jgi:hypothetical protein
VLQEGQTLGLILVADGADLNGDRLLGDPDLAFVDRQEGQRLRSIRPVG